MRNRHNQNNPQVTEKIFDMATDIVSEIYRNPTSDILSGKRRLFQLIDESKERGITCDDFKYIFDEKNSNRDLPNEKRADLYFTKAKICTFFDEAEIDEIKQDFNRAKELSENKFFESCADGQSAILTFIGMARDFEQMAGHFAKELAECCPGLFGRGLRNPVAQPLRERNQNQNRDL